MSLNLKTIAAAAVLAVGSTGAMAVTPGDVVFSTDFGCSQSGATASFLCMVGGDTGAGQYFWELILGATGKTTISSVTFNGTPVAATVPGKAFYDMGGPFSGKWLVEVAGSSTGKGSVGGSVSISAAVPEPQTYALMIAGLAAVGFIARRRRQG